MKILCSSFVLLGFLTFSFSGFAQVPTLTLDKSTTTADYTAVGDTIDYSYSVTVDLQLVGAVVTIADNKVPPPPCPPMSGIGNGDDNLDPGETVICTAVYVVTQDDIDVGSVTNVAIATAAALVSDSDTVTVNAVQNPALTLDKSTTTAYYKEVGDTINYSYKVTNSGNITLTEPITIADNKTTATCPPVSGVGDNDDNLDPGETIICTKVGYVVTMADITIGSVTNIATASAARSVAPFSTVTSPSDTVTVTKNSWTLFRAAINSAIDFELLVRLAGTGHGEVISKLPGIDCNTDCIEVYSPNTSVTLTATTAIDSFFAGWVGACESSLEPTCTVNMSHDLTVTAIFTLRPVVIEQGLWWGLHNGGRPTFYFSKLMADYPSTFIVKMKGCETVVVTDNNGIRFETNLLIIKQSDVSGRGMAVTTTGGVCESSRECSVTYYK